jgi:hypothetical protein
MPVASCRSLLDLSREFECVGSTHHARTRGRRRRARERTRVRRACRRLPNACIVSTARPARGARAAGRGRPGRAAGATGTATGRVSASLDARVKPYGFYPSMHYAARPSLPDPQAHVFSHNTHAHTSHAHILTPIKHPHPHDPTHDLRVPPPETPGRGTGARNQPQADATPGTGTGAYCSISLLSVLPYAAMQAKRAM